MNQKESLKSFAQSSARFVDQEVIRDSVAESRGIDIVYQNVAYSVQVPDEEAPKSAVPCKKAQKEKQILRGVSGIFKAGRVSAIMGASGAGKTTLLNVLACRIKSTGERSRLLANELEYDYSSFGDFANYVMQSDLLVETLTVRETLEFAGRLKLDLPEEERTQQVTKLANELKLEKCLDTLVGGVLLKGISGGEKKRTSIAFELISDPQVVFLDEPTSGLDSLTSYIIVSYLRSLATRSQKTVIMTIHQPNSETFELFDDLTILLEGRLIYQDRAAGVVKHFSDNFGLECPKFVNPSDFFMSKIHYEDPQNRERYPDYFETYSKMVEPAVSRRIQAKSKSEVRLRSRKVPYLKGVSALLGRLVTNVFRNPILLKAKFLQSLFVWLYVGGLFFGAGDLDYTQSGNFNYLVGFMFFITIAALMSVLTPVSIEFPKEKVVLYKELDSKMYDISQYFVAKNLIEIPELFLIPLATIPIYYFMVGLDSDASAFFTHLLTFFFISLSGASLGQLIGSIANDPKDVSAFTSLAILPIFIFSGVFKNREDLPGWIGWFEYLSPNKYGFNALILIEVEGRPSRIDQLNLDLSLWGAIAGLFGIGLAFRILGFICLNLLKKRSQ